MRSDLAFCDGLLDSGAMGGVNPVCDLLQAVLVPARSFMGGARILSAGTSGPRADSDTPAIADTRPPTPDLLPAPAARLIARVLCPTAPGCSRRAMCGPRPWLHCWYATGRGSLWQRRSSCLALIYSALPAACPLSHSSRNSWSWCIPSRLGATAPSSRQISSLTFSIASWWP